MDPIVFGQHGPEVEDVQQRLLSIGYDLGNESVDGMFGDHTLEAVKEFQKSHNLEPSGKINEETWYRLVDASFELGQRSLYLRYPNFHGADVETLQTALNILGFGAGEVDGIFGLMTEAALKEFQANVGLAPDGIAFQDTFDAIKRLHHVWENKVPKISTTGHRGFARAMSIIETVSLGILGLDPISRNIAGRMWNLAT
ncbi:MAG: peptidoglycan-binding protein, partial [Coriobacteriia bacterium]|nr:peptidoglycan-binding protein [Coriobacteriia bacterium]